MDSPSSCSEKCFFAFVFLLVVSLGFLLVVKPVLVSKCQ
jgi:hypothetical protein